MIPKWFEFDPSVGRRISVDLVAAHVTGTETLGETVALIVERLPDLLAQAPQGVDVASRVARLTGNVAAGYSDALRNHSFGQQDEAKRARSLAWWNVERDLRAREARFREVFDSSPVGIAISEPGGRIIQTNQSLEHTLGYSAGELSGRELSELFSPGDWPVVEKRYQDLVTGRDSRFRVRFPLRRADGESAWVYLVASVAFDAEQAPRDVVTIVDDITDLLLLEQRLHHQTLHDVQTGLPNRRQRHAAPVTRPGHPAVGPVRPQHRRHRPRQAPAGRGDGRRPGDRRAARDIPAGGHAGYSTASRHRGGTELATPAVRRAVSRTVHAGRRADRCGA